MRTPANKQQAPLPAPHVPRNFAPLGALAFALLFSLAFWGGVYEIVRHVFK